MRRLQTSFISALSVLLFSSTVTAQKPAQPELKLDDLEYFEMQGINVTAFQDIYPEGHQSGVSIIQNGVRIASSGDLRLDPVPGQWQPVPKQDKRIVDRQGNQITASLSCPDTTRNRNGFNPLHYPELNLSYQVRVRGDGRSFRIYVDLDKPLPSGFVGKVGFNLEPYPGGLFGRSWYLGEKSGIFPRQGNGPEQAGSSGEIQPVALAAGQRLSIAPESESLRLAIKSRTGDLQLLDARNKHNNGWFVVRPLVASGAAAGAVEWVVTPHAIPGWIHQPVVHVSQVGHHPMQGKTAVIRLGRVDPGHNTLYVKRISENGGFEEMLSGKPSRWGKFLRYEYLGRGLGHSALWCGAALPAPCVP